MNKYESRRKDLNYIKRYCQSVNAASASEVDANSNVSNKNIATMAPEIHKKDNIYANRLMMHDKIKELYGEELADEYLRQLECHEIYRHDESGMPIGTPYTYSAQEAILVKTPSGVLCTSLEELYEICDKPEFLVDTHKCVYQKNPEGWFAFDRTGLTPITVLTKKKRHRNLVCVKTQFGENLIVTDNHPMIVADDVNDTVEASECMGRQQYRVSYPFTDESGLPPVSDSLSVTKGDRYHYYVVHREGNHKHISAPNFTMDENLGYVIGFFISEGWFVKDCRNGRLSMKIKVKGDEDLHVCCDKLFLSTGIAASISKYEDSRGFITMTISHPDFVSFCYNTLRLGTKASQKKLPLTIFQYPKSFARGLVCGLVDGDGTEHRGRFLVRLASRTCISQLSAVLHWLGVSSSMSYHDQIGNEKSLIKSSYPSFGIEFPSKEFSGSRKFTGEEQKFTKYSDDCWAEVISVTPIQNTYFLKDNKYIYDITTDSHSFVMNNLWVHNCASITLYPFLFHGMEKLGGTTSAPKHLKSFIGGFINLVFAVSAQLCGAVATPEFFAYMDHFIRKSYGDDYYLYTGRMADLALDGGTVDDVIVGYFNQVVYSLNQPAAARGSQSVKRMRR